MNLYLLLMSLQVGEKIPDTLGKNQDGKEITLKQFAGKKLVLYFYPKDNTSGCTAEACSFRDYHSKLRALGYEVVGVSVDSEQSHQKFIEKQQLPFDIIADVEKKLVQYMGVWGEKNMYGRKYMGTFRTTFIINEQGVIERIFSPKEIKTSSHAQQVIEEITR
jgi:peroxiredoxin Q/BCP